MKKLPLKKLLWAVIPALLLTACIFDGKDSGNVSVTVKGKLSDLDTVGLVTLDSTGARYYGWILTLDSATVKKLPEENAHCTYTGYLGDSVATDYTNPKMYRAAAGSVFRTETLYLYRETDAQVFTDYRAVITCSGS